MKLNSVNIRNAVLEDAEQIVKIYEYYVINTAITFEYEVPTIKEFKNRMINIMKKYPYLVAETDGIIKGYAYGNVFKPRAAYDWSSEVTIYISDTAKKCGIGRKLYDVLEQKLGSMGIVNLYACIGYPEVEDDFLTKNSAEFHEHMGFTKVGEFHKCGYKFNRWYNMIWMEKIIGEHNVK